MTLSLLTLSVHSHMCRFAFPSILVVYEAVFQILAGDEYALTILAEKPAFCGLSCYGALMKAIWRWHVDAGASTMAMYSGDRHVGNATVWVPVGNLYGLSDTFYMSKALCSMSDHHTD